MQITNNTISRSEVKRRCDDFKVGDTVLVIGKDKGEDIEDHSGELNKARIVGRFPHMLVVRYKNGVHEQFTYNHIASANVLKKYEPRKRKKK